VTIRGVTQADAAPIAALIRELAGDAITDIAARLTSVLARDDHRVWVPAG
jgi:hypothetical protein